MRTNIVLNDALVAQAMQLSGASSKKELIHNALRELVQARKQQAESRQGFIKKYINHPIKLDLFQPLSRDEANAR
ncbi:hypothetical protein MNBD_GAMMA26-637 [hydrothermal vent metagenome]|uniref:Antitoxin to Toxin 1, PIN domain n=1 Tax=hydrothermal vent metagenome TaxID=652676 RepID=A0A3B1B1Y7_9ZZZZ